MPRRMTRSERAWFFIAVVGGSALGSLLLTGLVLASVAGPRTEQVASAAVVLAGGGHATGNT
jgi:hypothetical protein